MRTLLTIAALLGLILPSRAADQLITLRITLTNSPANGAILTVNGDSRTWTNEVSAPPTQVLATNVIGANATNLFAHLALYGFAGPLALDFASSNQVTLRGRANQAISASVSAGWASLSYSTNLLTNLITVRVPAAAESQAIRRFVADELVKTIGDNALTSQIPASAAAFAQFVDTSEAQTVAGAKDFTSGSGRWRGEMTNGVLRRVRIEYDIYGSGIQFHDLNGDQVFDLRADIQGFPSLFFTYPDPDGTNAATIDPQPHHILTYSTATNKLASKSIPNTWTATQTFNAPIAIGAGASVSGVVTGGHLLGATFSGTISNLQGGTISNTTLFATKVDYNRPESGIYYRDQNDDIVTSIRADDHGVPSLYLSYGSPTATDPYFGLPAAPNILSWATATNSFGAKALPNTWTAAQTIAHQLLFSGTVISSLANGNNAGVNVGNAVWAKLTVGPTAAFTIAGLAGGSDGRLVILYNATSQNMTIANQSGIESTAANRIVTMTGADVATTGSGAAVFIYDANASRWILIASEL